MLASVNLKEKLMTNLSTNQKLDRTSLIRFTYDEVYEMSRLYETICDLELEVDPLIDSAFAKIMEVE